MEICDSPGLSRGAVQEKPAAGTAADDGGMARTAGADIEEDDDRPYDLPAATRNRSALHTFDAADDIVDVPGLG